MEQMIEHINNNTGTPASAIRGMMHQYAEKYAELYVSAELGLEEGEEKQTIKGQYIDLFIEELRKKL